MRPNYGTLTEIAVRQTMDLAVFEARNQAS